MGITLRVTVKPNNKTVKDLVKQFGNIWILRDSIFDAKLRELGWVKDVEKILETTINVHNNKTEPFAMWITVGKECDVEEVR